MSNSPLLRIWAWPVALAVLSASGLLSALVSDGWGDAWSWFALGLPVVVMAWFGLRRPAADTAGHLFDSSSGTSILHS